MEQGVLYDEIVQVVIGYGYTTWTEVCKQYKGQPEYMLLLSSRPSIITEVLKDNWRKANPDGRVQRVQLVNDEIKKGKV